MWLVAGKPRPLTARREPLFPYILHSRCQNLHPLLHPRFVFTLRLGEAISPRQDQISSVTDNFRQGLEGYLLLLLRFLFPRGGPLGWRFQATIASCAHPYGWGALDEKIGHGGGRVPTGQRGGGRAVGRSVGAERPRELGKRSWMRFKGALIGGRRELDVYGRGSDVLACGADQTRHRARCAITPYKWRRR